MWVLKTILALISLLSSTWLASQSPNDRDTIALYGWWEVVSWEYEGKSQIRLFRSTLIGFGDGEFAMTDGFAAPRPAQFKLNPTSSPKSIDVSEQGERAPTMTGIYAFENDTLKLCLRTSADRPTGFQSKPGDKTTVAVLKRHKPFDN